MCGEADGTLNLRSTLDIVGLDPVKVADTQPAVPLVEPDHTLVTRFREWGLTAF